MNDEIVVPKIFSPEVLHYSVLYAFNESEVGPLIRWQMHEQEVTARRQNTVYNQSLVFCLHVYILFS